jgi:hypothetical protein
VEQGAIGTLTEWQNLYPRREIMVLGMGLKEAAAVKYKISLWGFIWTFLNFEEDFLTPKENYWHLIS